MHLRSRLRCCGLLQMRGLSNERIIRRPIEPSNIQLFYLHTLDHTHLHSSTLQAQRALARITYVNTQQIRQLLPQHPQSWIMPHATPTLLTKLMQQLLLSELVALQCVLTFVDDDVLPARVQKEISVLGADGTVAAANFLD